MPSPPVTNIGPYLVEKELGRGANGAVYLARRGPGGHPCALKVFLKPQDQEGLGRFQLEVDLLKQLRHPAIVGALESGHHGQFPWVAMDYVEGESLRERMKRGPLGAEEARELIRAVAEALIHAHGSGVVHRDLKPANIMIARESRRPFVTDFGLARHESGWQSLTRTGDVVGTPYYMSPEQLHDSKRVDARSDVYALGVILYECLSGQLPFPGKTVTEVFAQIERGRPRRLREVAPDAPAGLVEACERAMLPRADDRWQSAQEFVDALLSRGRSRRDPRRVAILAGALATGLALGLIGVVVARTRDRAPVSVETERDAAVAETVEGRKGPSPKDPQRERLRRLGERLASLDPKTVSLEELRLLDPPRAPELEETLDGMARGLLVRAKARAAGHAQYDQLLEIVDLAERFASDPVLKAQAQLDRATYAFRRGRFEEASRLARAIVARGRLALQARYVAAYGDLWQDRFSSSLRALKRIWDDDPDGVVGQNAGAVYNSHNGQNDVGARLARAALALDPTYVDAHCSLAFCLNDLSHVQEDQKEALLAESLKSSAEAIRLAPDHPRPYMARAFALNNSGRQEEALQAYSDVIRLTEPKPMGRVLRFRARHRFQNGDIEGAYSDLERAIDRDPYDAEALVWRGVMREQRGDSSGAAGDWVQAYRANQAGMSRALRGMGERMRQHVIEVVRRRAR